MPALVESLIAQPEFGLTLLAAGDGGATVIDWVHASDLENPSPFLPAGTMLLTTGRQFSERSDDGFVARYVTQLVEAGVVALGFGTEVLREGTPGDLISACQAAGLPLVEVPYRIPFISISRWVAGVQATDARARVDWALTAQNAVSLAALGAGGLSAVIERAATELGCGIQVFDPDGEAMISHGVAGAEVPTASGEIAAEVTRLLRAQRRARTTLAVDRDVVTVLTLGGSHRLRGAMVLRRPAPFDAADTAVVTTLTALAEVSLEHSQDLRTSLRSLMTELFLLLRDGHVDAVRKAIEAIPVGLPGRRFVVVALDIAAASRGLRDFLERRASLPRSGLFVVGDDDRLTLLADQRAWTSIRDAVRGAEARVGVSSPVTWDQLGSGLVQATRALDRSAAAEITEFSDLVKTSFFGLLSSASVAEIASARLGPLLATADGSELLAEAAEWLRQNGQWDPAARTLGIHRHTLKARISALEKQLGLRLENFQDRAELWALLAAAHVTPRG